MDKCEARNCPHWDICGKYTDKLADVAKAKCSKEYLRNNPDKQVDLSNRNAQKCETNNQRKEVDDLERID